MPLGSQGLGTSQIHYDIDLKLPMTFLVIFALNTLVLLELGKELRDGFDFDPNYQ